MGKIARLKLCSDIKERKANTIKLSIKLKWKQKLFGSKLY